MIGEGLGRHMIVIDRREQDLPFGDQDHHPAAQGDHGVGVHEALIVETTGPMVAQVHLTGDVGHRPHYLVTRSKHLVEHPRTPPEFPRLMPTKAE